MATDPEAVALVARPCWCGSALSRRMGELPCKCGGYERKYPLLKCEGCGVWALFPQPDDADLEAAYGAEYYGASPRKFSGPVARVIGWFQGGRARQAARWIPPSSRVLDVGCGNGGFLLQLQRLGYSVEGTERSARSAARAPSDIPVHVGDLLDIALPEGRYDAIAIWHVFEHLRRPAETMKKIRALLKPGGLLLIAVPNAGSAQAERYGVHWLHHDPPRHLFGFDPDSLRRILQECGFTVEDLDTHSLEQNPFGEIQSRLNAAGMPRDRLYNQLKGISSEPLPTRFSDLVRMALLAIPAVVRSSMEARRGEGASLIVVARGNT